MRQPVLISRQMGHSRCFLNLSFSWEDEVEAEVEDQVKVEVVVEPILIVL
jgi:hypothetical protein